MSRGLDDPGLNKSMSDFMQELNEEADRKQRFIDEVGRGVVDSIQKERNQESVKHMLEARAKSEANIRERIRRETGIDPFSLDAYASLARSMPRDVK